MTNDPNWEEYTLLQGKIDRIGAAKFQIKGWTVTLVTVVIVAGLTSGLSGVSMIVMIWIIGTSFFLLEREQLRLSRSYGKRVLQLEHVLRSKAKRGATPEEKSPRIAQFSMGALPRPPVMFLNKGMPPKVWRAIVNTDNSFYILILVVSVIVLFMPRIE